MYHLHRILFLCTLYVVLISSSAFNTVAAPLSQAGIPSISWLPGQVRAQVRLSLSIMSRLDHSQNPT
jgi:hypothetical protein